eukprot:13668312-Alexandrium_andersonii.AAC.1
MLRADHASAWARRNAFAGAYKERKQQEHQAAVKALTARKDAQISALMEELELSLIHISEPTRLALI